MKAFDGHLVHVSLRSGLIVLLLNFNGNQVFLLDQLVQPADLLGCQITLSFCLGQLLFERFKLLREVFTLSLPFSVLNLMLCQLLLDPRKLLIFFLK